MLTVALMAVLAASNPAQVVWVNACNISAEGVVLPQAATYEIWLWAPDAAKASVLVGTQEFSEKAVADHRGSKQEGRYGWAHVGKADLKAGSVPVKLGDKVAGIVFAIGADFDPKHFEHDVNCSALPEGVEDSRVMRARNTDTVFTMPNYPSIVQWEPVADRIRKRMLIGCGLYPLPERTPLKANISGRITHDDYTVEKVYFEARPGFLVTGNLYRPTGKGPFPGVVCPHGHWTTGRLENTDLCSVPGRSITLARMGMVVFTYDMIGYNDSCQFEHNWGGGREKLWGLHPFAMQLWSSIRAVDFLQTLPDVDKERIGCTGASGGGTQTFALCAVDKRIKVAAPVNMISCSMQGGCLCENAPLIRLENSNMEIGAMMAPRPLLMVSATGDWTRETPRIEFPAVRSIYQDYWAEGNVEMVQVKENHNYNKASREAVYRFFGKFLLGDAKKWADFTEPPFQVESTDALRVFPDKKLPAGLPDSKQILEQIVASSQVKWDAILPKSADGVKAFQLQYGDTLALATGCEIPQPNDLDPERASYDDRTEKGYVVEGWILHRRDVKDGVPAILYRPANGTPCDAVLIVHGEGKAALADFQAGGPGPMIRDLLAKGKAVMAIDTFLTGEYQGAFTHVKRHTIGTFSDTFEPTDTACRVQDVVTALAYLRSRRDLAGVSSLIGLGDGGLWSLFASAIDGQVPNTLVDMNQIDVCDDSVWTDRFYIPGIRAIGDVQTATMMIAPRGLQIWNVKNTAVSAFKPAERVYGKTICVADAALASDAIMNRLP